MCFGGKRKENYPSFETELFQHEPVLEKVQRNHSLKKEGESLHKT